MGKEIERLAGAFLKGMATFAAFPTAPAPRLAPRRAERGIGRHFASVGKRMKRAAERMEVVSHG